MTIAEGNLGRNDNISYLSAAEVNHKVALDTYETQS